MEEADEEILHAIASRRKLASDLELAKGIQYTEAMKTSCVPVVDTPSYFSDIDPYDFGTRLGGDRHGIFVNRRKSSGIRSATSIILLLREMIFHLRYRTLRFVSYSRPTLIYPLTRVMECRT